MKHSAKNFLFIFGVSIIFNLTSCIVGDPVIPGSVPPLSPEQTIDVKETDARTIVKAMKFGWNLGNTLDATGTGNEIDGYNYNTFENISGENDWGLKNTASKELFHFLKESGISTVRLPVSWHNHIVDSNYTINSQWMAHVKEIVDMAIEENLFVIINIHHDNVAEGKVTSFANGYAPSNTDKTLSEKYLTKVWEQICLTFNNNYDGHLIFETLNEPRLINHEHEWNFQSGCKKCEEAMNCINSYNQICLNTIRKSGGNNANRTVMIPSYVASPTAATQSSFKLPTDSAKNRLALSVHMYTPYNFAMENPGSVTFTESHKNDLLYHFKLLNNNFIKKGIPVVIGEMGATNKNNLTQRENWFEYYLTLCKQYEVAAVLWDNGNPNATNNDYSEKFGYLNRTKKEWYFPSLIQKAVNAIN